MVFGPGNGQLELRYMPANADAEAGRPAGHLRLDGIFLPGSRSPVTNIERDSAYLFRLDLRTRWPASKNLAS